MVLHGALRRPPICGASGADPSVIVMADLWEPYLDAA